MFFFTEVAMVMVFLHGNENSKALRFLEKTLSPALSIPYFSVVLNSGWRPHELSFIYISKSTGILLSRSGLGFMLVRLYASTFKHFWETQSHRNPHSSGSYNLSAPFSFIIFFESCVSKLCCGCTI